MSDRLRSRSSTASGASFAPVRSNLLQRKCACGGSNSLAGGCEECKEKETMQRKAGGKRSQTFSAPPIVNEVLDSPGQPLDDSTRAFFEPRFSHDFSRVRVHTDARAAESAQAVNALAYTVGSHIVFEAGRYAPASSAGQKLMAHELTHVVQQDARLQRQSISSQPGIEVGHADDELEREADNAAREVSRNDDTQVLRRSPALRLQRIPAIEGLDEGGPKAEITGGEKEDRFRECVRTGGPDPEQCDPTGALTWANFSGTPSGTFDAFTVAPVEPVDVPIQNCLQLVYGRTTGPTKRFRAKLDSAKSWVRPIFKNATDPAKNGCPPQITGCQTFFDQEAAAGRTGGTFAMRTTPSTTCPASATPRGDSATKKTECATKVGADCNDRAVAESARLLSHEQGHFDIACVFAKKANTALAAGGDLDKIKKAVKDKLQPTQDSYDTDTNHGCNAAPQATWKTKIADNLKAITIP